MNLTIGNDKELTCPHCGHKTAKNKYSIEEIILEEHSKKTTQKCPKCKKTFEYSSLAGKTKQNFSYSPKIPPEVPSPSLYLMGENDNSLLRHFKFDSIEPDSIIDKINNTEKKEAFIRKRCPKCGGELFFSGYGSQRYRCQKCGEVWHTDEIREHILVPHVYFDELGSHTTVLPWSAYSPKIDINEVPSLTPITPQKDIIFRDESHLTTGTGHPIKIKRELTYSKTPKIFKVNEYITLKLEHNKTNLYVGDELIDSCKYLLMNPDPSRSYEEIHSIDELKAYLDSSLEGDILRSEYNISPEEEFWGHCSNIQAWAENGYDIRLIHSKLAIPILKKLLKVLPEKIKFLIYERIIEILEELCKAHPNPEVVINYYLRLIDEIPENLIKEAFLIKYIYLTNDKHHGVKMWFLKEEYKPVLKRHESRRRDVVLVDTGVVLVDTGINTGMSESSNAQRLYLRKVSLSPPSIWVQIRFHFQTFLVLHPNIFLLLFGRFLSRLLSFIHRIKSRRTKLIQ